MDGWGGKGRSEVVKVFFFGRGRMGKGEGGFVLVREGMEWGML